MVEFARLAKLVPEGRSTRWRYRPRILICMNAVELLFDNRKRPKNREIADYLALLCSEKSEDLPFDLISVGALGRMGHFFASDTRLKRHTFAWTELKNDDQSELAHRAKSYGLNCVTALNPLVGPSKEPVNYVHMARRADPLRVLIDNFPVLAMALLQARKDREYPDKRLDKPGDLCKAVKQAHITLNEVRNAEWLKPQPPDCNQVYLQTQKAFKIEVADGYVEAPLTQTGLTRTQRQSYRSATDKLGAFADILFTQFEPKKNTPDYVDWRDLTEVLEGNRFCLTILLAAAEQLVFTESIFAQGGKTANEFLENVVSALRNASAGRREEIVLNEVMSVNRQLSRTGDADFDHDFHQLLLRNISTLGCPVSPNVLVRLPDIREYFNRVRFEGKLSRRRMAARALAALSERGLLFRISPHPKLLRLSERVDYWANKPENETMTDEDERPLNLNRISAPLKGWPAAHEFRYAQHRQIQSYCFQRLGHLTAPPITANNFAPTLYAAMPSRVVRLSTEGYLFLRRLLLGLSQYPDIRHEDAARAMPIFSDDDVVTKVQALRAGLSLARTCFSIAAVSRFDNETTGLGFIRKRGHFETYRVRLRWILRKAWEVHEPRSDSKDPRTDDYRVNALYSDEIVWLYNEVAVTCLVQGNLTEAIGHARQAVFLNRRVEGPNEFGRMHNMLSLNMAIIQFERGRLQAAETRLNAIVASEGTMNPPAAKLGSGKGKKVRKNKSKRGHLANLAKGYLALIVQLQGRRSEAKKRLEKVIAQLEIENEDRALAIMLHHLARLVAAEDTASAALFVKRARAYAEKGGHEDVRHRILVSEVWISQGFIENPQDRMEADRVKLRDAERYSETMGLHSLLVESLHAQGAMLLKAGDYSRSGRLMTKAMAIARRNDMGLRLNATMTNYARVLLARRRVASAKRLLHAALAMAKRSGYSLEVTRIQHALDDAERQTTTADTPTAGASRRSNS